MTAWSVGRRGDLVEPQRSVDDQAEGTAAGLLDANGAFPLVETALQQDEPAVEVVAKLGKLERRIEPDLLVREVRASFPVVVAEQRPENTAGDSLDEVVATDERAAV